jgi:hypothetical protein
MPDRSRCPNCGERVSPYAAGCAVCGADLDTKRWDRGPSAGNRVGSWLSALSFGPQRGGYWPLIIFFAFIFFGGSIMAFLFGLFS